MYNMRVKKVRMLMVYLNVVFFFRSNYQPTLVNSMMCACPEDQFDTGSGCQRNLFFLIQLVLLFFWLLVSNQLLIKS